MIADSLIWMIPLGFAVGVLGSMIGAGGGFILVPVLLMVYPNKNPDIITSISLAVVFFNALSGSTVYSMMKRIDYKSGLIFSIAVVPGSIIGAFNIAYVSRHSFNLIFGFLLLTVSIFLIFRPEIKTREIHKDKTMYIHRNIIDAQGINYIYSYNPVIGIALGLVVGYMSSLLGIGGGIIHVPALVQLLNFPVHIATATSHFMLAIMSATGSVVHFINGTLSKDVLLVLCLSAGVIPGGICGARLSKYVHGKLIIRLLACALGIVSFRILFMSLLK